MNYCVDEVREQMSLINKMKKRTKNDARKLMNSLRYPRAVNLNKSQWWTFDKLMAFQNDRLRKMLEYAYRNIPAYKKKFDDVQARPQDIQCIDDLKGLPFTTREEMQENPNFVNKDLITSTLYTGGSTGSTLRYFESYESGRMRWHVHLRGWGWSGYVHGKKRLAVISSSQGVVAGKNVINLLGDLSEENIRENIRQILEFRPQHFRGYVSSLYIMARYCIDHDISISSIGSVNTISENLYDYQRETIEEGFRTKVFDEYVCNDGGACAWECDAHEGLHYNMERAIIEEINGEAIVTDLWNKAMPFIRYRNGDSITFLGNQCSCGRALPLITVKGRSNDILISRKGPVSPTFLMHHGSGLVGADKKMKAFRSGIRTVQYVQKPGFRLIMNIVKNPWCQNQEIEQLKENLRDIASGLDVHIQIVNEIPSSPKGKKQFIINEDEGLLKKWGL